MHPAPPRIVENTAGVSDAQAQAMADAEREAAEMGLEAVRTQGKYEEKKGKIGKITKKKWYIVDPRSSKLVPYWDAVGMSALVFTAIVTTAEVAFVDSPGCIDALFIINRCVDFIFVMDGFLQFFLMYPQAPKSATETIVWVHDQDKIAMHYLTTWCFPDFFSVGVAVFDLIALNRADGGPWSVCPVPGMPTSSIGPDGFLRPDEQMTQDLGGSAMGTLKLLRIIKLMKLTKLIRLVRSSRIMKRFESRTAINYGHLALFKSLVLLVIASHWFACIWGLITTFEEGAYDSSWYVVFGYCQFDTLRTPDAGGVQAAYLANPTDDNYAASRLQLGSDIYYSCVAAQDRCAAALCRALATLSRALTRSRALPRPPTPSHALLPRPPPTPSALSGTWPRCTGPS